MATTKKLEQYKMKIQFAAFHFIYTSRDGMVISNLINVSPRNLHKMYMSDEWEEALAFWNYTGTSEIQGEQYRVEVGRYKVKQGFKEAQRLWLQLFNISPNQHGINRHLKD